MKMSGTGRLGNTIGVRDSPVRFPTTSARSVLAKAIEAGVFAQAVLDEELPLAHFRHTQELETRP